MPHQICNKISSSSEEILMVKLHALAVPCGSAMYLTFSHALLLRQLYNNTELLNSSLRGTSSQTKNYPSCADLD